MIYLDSSAVVKLVRREDNTAELVAWLADRSDSALISSVLVEVEVPSAIRRNAPAALVAVPAVLARLYRLEIDETVRATAAAHEDADLRSLDAIHLATAEVARAEADELEAFVAYDDRLLAAAAAAGLPVASPQEEGHDGVA